MVKKGDRIFFWCYTQKRSYQLSSTNNFFSGLTFNFTLPFEYNLLFLLFTTRNLNILQRKVFRIWFSILHMNHLFKWLQFVRNQPVCFCVSHELWCMIIKHSVTLLLECYYMNTGFPFGISWYIVLKRDGAAKSLLYNHLRNLNMALPRKKPSIWVEEKKRLWSSASKRRQAMTMYVRTGRPKTVWKSPKSPLKVAFLKWISNDRFRVLFKVYVLAAFLETPGIIIWVVFGQETHKLYYNCRCWGLG